MTKNSPMDQFFSPHNIKAGDMERTIFRHQLEQNFDKEELLKPEKWRQVAKSHPTLKAGSIIEVLREDNAFYAELLVVGRVNDEIFIKFIHFVKLEDDDVIEEKLVKESDFEITWKGPMKKFSLIRKSDSKEIKDKFSSKEEAKHWFKNNY